MYYIHNKLKKNGEQFLVMAVRKISLAGCNVGIIPKQLREKLQPAHTAPLQWELNIGDIYAVNDQSVIIDFKPNSKDQVLMGELTHVFGDSNEGTSPWTPVLLRLRMVADMNNIGEIEQFNKENFKPYENPDIVYTMGHLYGSLSKGELVGTWNQGRGSLNSVLLWSSTLNYFVSCIRKTDPDLITSIK